MLSLFAGVQPELEPGQISALGLAYIGDGVYELLARAYVLKKGGAKVSVLHSRGVGLCRAGAQAGAARVLLPLLTESEQAVFRRGRNAKPHSSPKSALPGEYALATALEALFGWLYLSGQTQRLEELWNAALRYFEEVG